MWFSLRIAVSSQHFYEDVKSTINFWVIAGVHFNAPSTDTSTYFLYGTAIPPQPSFPYLGIPIGPGGYLLSKDLIQHIVNKTLQTMNRMSAIGANHKGFSPLLSIRFCSQIVRSQLEYGLAVSAISSTQMKKLEECQTKCIRSIFGGNPRSSTKVMLHLTNQPTMKERVHRLQGKCLLRPLNGPEDTLLSHFLPYLRTSASLCHWYKLSKTPAWQRCCTSDNIESLNIWQFNAIFKDFRQENLQKQCAATNSVLLSACHPILGVDPILWLPMNPAERNRLAPWMVTRRYSQALYLPSQRYFQLCLLSYSLPFLFSFLTTKKVFSSLIPFLFDLTRAMQSSKWLCTHMGFKNFINKNNL